MKTLLISILLLSSCKGPEGQKGERGTPGTVTNYQGVVSSDAQVISVGEYGNTSNLTVLVGDGVNMTECPFFAPAAGYNVYYVANNRVVTIYNAHLVGATQYRITVINSASAASFGRKLS